MRAFVLAAVVALASAAPAQAAEPDAPDGDRVRLKWGPRAPATHGLQAAPRTPPDAEAAATLESRGEGSLFKVRLAFPQFSVMATSASLAVLANSAGCTSPVHSPTTCSAPGHPAKRSCLPRGGPRE